MRFWFKRKCQCPDKGLVLVEEYQRGPWKLDCYYAGGLEPPTVDVAQYVDGKWKCPTCDKLHLKVRRLIWDTRFGYPLMYQ